MLQKLKNLARRRPFLFVIMLLVVIGLPAITITAHYVDRSGTEFFETGKIVLRTLGTLADGVEQRDYSLIESTYAEDFSGQLLGLTQMSLVDEKDGTTIEAFRSTGATPDRAAAVDEWRTYLEGFEEIDEAGIYIAELHSWNSDTIVATVRYEMIGRPFGAARSGIDRANFMMTFRPNGERPLITSAELIDGDRLLSNVPQFTDVAPAAGVDFANQYYPPFLTEDLEFAMLRYGPAGITTADYDNDGLYDLFIPDGVESRLYRNTGDGQFEDVTESSGLAGLAGVSVGLFADFDNDGWKDFFVSRTFTPNQIFKSNGDGTFTDITAETGINEDCCTTVASVGDYDNDGDLDLYVGRYLDPRLAIPTTFYARNGEPNQLYRNDGDFKFTNVTEEAGVGEVGLCLGTVFGDYDDDGDPDLYVVNDFGRKTLYRNNGDGTFADVTVETGTLAYGAGMSASFGDYDNDLLLDIYVAHIRSEEGWFAAAPTVWRYMFNTMRQGVWVTDMPLYFQIFQQSGFRFVEVFQQMASGNTLLRNKGDGTFEDTTWEANANPPGWFWGSQIADYDNDGWQDIYTVNGWVYNDQDTEIELEFLNNVVSEMKTYKTGLFFDPQHFGSHSWHGWERNRHLRNEGDGTFREIGRASGLDLLLNSRGIAVADYWNRGVLDIAVAASTDKHALLRNDVGAVRNWFEVELIGAGPDLENGTNRDAVGARAYLKAGDLQAMREVFLGDSYGSQNMLRLHFGLDELESIDELKVVWPISGREQVFSNVAANRIVRVVEGRDELLPIEAPSFPEPFADVVPGTDPGRFEAAENTLTDPEATE